MVDGITVRLLGRHILRRSRDHAATSHAGVVNRACESKVSDVDTFDSVFQKNIRRFDITMNKSLLVGCGQSVCNLCSDADSFDHLQRTGVLNASINAPAFHHGHHQIRKPSVLIDSLDRHHMRMHDSSCTSGFTRKSFPGRRITGEFWCEYLHCRMSIQRRVVSTHHDSHAAASEDFHNLVPSEPTKGRGVLARLKEARVGSRRDSRVFVGAVSGESRERYTAGSQQFCNLFPCQTVLGKSLQL